MKSIYNNKYRSNNWNHENLKVKIKVKSCDADTSAKVLLKQTFYDSKLVWIKWKKRPGMLPVVWLKEVR